MRDVVAHTKARSISVFQPVRIPCPKTSPRDRGTSAQRRITIWLAMTAARFAFRPGERRRRAARIECLRPYTASGAFSGKCKGTKGDDTLSTGRMLIGQARQGFPPHKPGPRPARVRGKRARRDRPTSADKLSAPLYKAQRRASCAPLPASENGTVRRRRSLQRFTQLLTHYQRDSKFRFIREAWNSSFTLLSRLYNYK